jgi:hypothetical protein
MSVGACLTADASALEALFAICPPEDRATRGTPKAERGGGARTARGSESERALSGARDGAALSQCLTAQEPDHGRRPKGQAALG